MATKPEGVPNWDDAGAIQASEGGEGWHPELPRVKFEGLLGKDLVFLEIEKRQCACPADFDH